MLIVMLPNRSTGIEFNFKETGRTGAPSVDKISRNLNLSRVARCQRTPSKEMEGEVPVTLEYSFQKGLFHASSGARISPQFYISYLSIYAMRMKAMYYHQCGNLVFKLNTFQVNMYVFGLNLFLVRR